MAALSFSSDFWNIANPQNASVTWQVSPGAGLTATITASDVVQYNSGTTVAAFPNVAYGQSAFGGPPTVTADGLQLPASVASLQAAPPIWLSASYSVDNSQNNIPLDVAYDMFFTAQPAANVSNESPKTLGGGLEVMIWTDKENHLMPSGGGAGLVEQVLLPASIDGGPVTDTAFNVYVGKGGAGTELTTFALVDPIASGSVSVDLSAVLADLALPKIAAADGVSGAAIAADYLDSIQLGTEFGPGTGTESFIWNLSALSIDGAPIIGPPTAALALKGDSFSDGTLEVAAQDKLKLKNGKITVNLLTVDPGATIAAKGGAGGASFIVTPVIDNGGLIEATGGDLLLKNAQVNNAAGAEIYAGPGAIVSLASAVIENGTLATDPTGAIETTDANSVFDNLTNTGAVIVNDSTALTLMGTIDNAGTIALDAVGGAKLNIDGDVVLSGGGAVEMTDSSGNAIQAGASAASLTNEETVEGAGQLGNAELTFVNDASGVVLGTGSNPLKINTGTNTVINAGTIKAAGAGGVVIASAVDNTGKLKVAGGVMTLQGAITGAGAVVISAGTLTFASSFDGDVTFTNGTGLLVLAQSQSYAGAITGFSATGGTKLDLEDIAWGVAVKAGFSGATGVLTVTDGVHTADIDLVGDFAGATFNATSDGHGGTYITTVAAMGGAAARMAQAMAALGGGGANEAPTQSPDSPPSAWKLAAPRLT